MFQKKAVLHIQNLYGNVYLKKSNDKTFVSLSVVQNYKSLMGKVKLYVLEKDDEFIDLKLNLTEDKTINKERIDVAI